MTTRTHKSHLGGASGGSSKARYEKVLRTVDYQTGGPGREKRAGVRRSELKLVLACHGPLSVEEVDRSLSVARDRGEVVVWRDERGRERLARRTREGLLAVVGEQNMRARPDVELVERIRGHLDAVTGGCRPWREGDWGGEVPDAE